MSDTIEVTDCAGRTVSVPADPQSISCYSWEQRYIYTGSFPNCAATVEDGSFCDTNDACYTAAVWYLGKKDCAKAWK